jgi:hypothetical protein
MSRRRKTKRVSHRRRRVSGVSMDGVMDLIAITAGFIGGNMLNKKVAENFATLDPKMAAAGTSVVGLIVSKKAKGVLSSVGKGVFVSGAFALAKDVMPTLVSGIGDDLVTFSNASLRGVGFPSPSVINGMNGTGPNFSEMSVISGPYNYGL